MRSVGSTPSPSKSLFSLIFFCSREKGELQELPLGQKGTHIQSVIYGRLLRTDLPALATPDIGSRRPLTLRPTDGQPQSSCSERCRGAEEREPASLGPEPGHGRGRNPDPVATRAFLGACSLGSDPRVAEIMWRCTGAKGALSWRAFMRRVLAQLQNRANPIGRDPESKSRSPPLGGLELLDWVEPDWAKT